MKLKPHFILPFLICSFLISCNSLDTENVHEYIEKQTDEVFESLIEIRRDFHEYPELAKNEKRTSKHIAEHLLRLGLEVKTDVAGYAVIGILRGEQDGKRIAWRADMDALPNNFPDEAI